MVKTPAQLLRNIPAKPRDCRTCGTSFVPFSVTPVTDALVVVCPDCAHADALEEQRQIIENCAKGTPHAKPSIVPEQFRDTVPNRLPKPSTLQKVMAWKYGPRGLMLHGDTGCGKSRCAWMLMKREHDAGKRVRALNVKAGFDYGARFSESPESARQWMDAQIAADILLLDDVFKIKLTESFECAIFAIVTMRMEDGKPIVTTTNDTPDSLIARMSVDRGAPLIRRLRESSTIINFA